MTWIEVRFTGMGVMEASYDKQHLQSISDTPYSLGLKRQWCLPSRLVSPSPMTAVTMSYTSASLGTC